MPCQDGPAKEIDLQLMASMQANFTRRCGAVVAHQASASPGCTVDKTKCVSCRPVPSPFSAELLPPLQDMTFFEEAGVDFSKTLSLVALRHPVDRVISNYWYVDGRTFCVPPLPLTYPLACIPFLFLRRRRRCRRKNVLVEEALASILCSFALCGHCA